MTQRDTRLPLISGPALAAMRPRTPYFAYLLALLALGFSGYVWKASVDGAAQSREQREHLAGLENRFVEAQRQQQHLVDDLALKARQLDEINAKLARWDDTLSADQRRVWLLSESDHYLRLAQQHLLLTRDVTGARTLLDVADRLLAAHGDNRLLPLRQAIARDRIALGAALNVDVAGLYLRLGALSEHVGTLQLPMLTGDRAQLRGEVVMPAATGAGPQATAGLLDAGWAKLRSLVTVRRYDEPIRPLLTDADRELVREALRLDLAQAQLALLRGEPAIYRSSLDTARGRLQRYFALLPKPELTGMRDELTALAAVDIRPALPDLAASIRALDALSGQAARVPAALDGVKQ